MRARLRIGLFLIAAAAMAALFRWSYRNLPPLRDCRGAYGALLVFLAGRMRIFQKTVSHPCLR